MQKLVDDSSFALNSADRKTVVAQIVGAPFPATLRPLSEWDRLTPTRFVGDPHPTKPGETLTLTTELSSLEWHVLKHRADGSVAPTTTPASYLAIIRAAVANVTATLDVGKDRTPGYPASRAATRTSSFHLKIEPDVINKPNHCFLVVYNQAQSKILTGYLLPSADAERRLSKWDKRRTFPP